MTDHTEKASAVEKEPGPFTELIFNLVIPVLILKKGSEWFGWSPTLSLIVALGFPLVYGLKDFFGRNKVNIFSVFGLINVLLTGVIGLMNLSPGWVAVKEATIPAVIGLIVVGSMWTRWPLIKTLLFNKRIIKVDLVEEKLEENGSKNAFESTLKVVTWLMGGSFLVSATLNYILARIMVKTHPSVDKDMFNQEISSMWIWSMVVIVVPSMIVMSFALWKLISGIKKHTGLTLEEMLVGAAPDSSK